MLSCAYLQAVRMIRDHSHEMSELRVPPKFSGDHSMHTRVSVERMFSMRRCACSQCTEERRKIITAGATAAVRDLFNEQHVDPTGYVLDKFSRGETNAKVS